MSQTNEQIRKSVQEYYAERARNEGSCCGGSCDSTPSFYAPELIQDLPENVAGFSLGCGDAISLANPQPGETLLDLGSGGGLECFLAARQVGENGHVIGIDMTPDMLERARLAAVRMGLKNVEFRQGYIEDLPVEENSIDVIISNCVINLSPDKPKVLAEAFRVLKPGGRLAVSDVVTTGELPEHIKNDLLIWSQCGAGALQIEEYRAILQSLGFVDIKITPKTVDDQLPDEIPADLLLSGLISARKPS